MNRFDALIATQKTSGFSFISEKNQKKKYIFLKDFLDFFRNGTLQRAEVFCVVISASKRFFKLSNNPLSCFSFFCHIMGGLFFQTPGMGGQNLVLNILKNILIFIIYYIQYTFRNIVHGSHMKKKMWYLECM